jgi:hypothetical protein
MLFVYRLLRDHATLLVVLFTLLALCFYLHSFQDAHVWPAVASLSGD